MKLLKTTTGLAAAFIACAISASAIAAIRYTGWADEFVSGHFQYGQTTTNPANWEIDHMWEGDDDGDLIERWGFVGIQFDGAARANAVEEVMFQFQDVGDYCVEITVQIDRWRTDSPPPRSSSCFSGGPFSYVGSKSYSVNSCSFAPADHLHWNRLLPTYDFSQETALGGVGYRSKVTATSSANGNSIEDTGCFIIDWRP